MFFKLMILIYLIVIPFEMFGEKTLIKVVGNNAPPYRIIEGDQFYGIYYDTLKEMTRYIDMEIEFIDVPFQRALKMMEYGEADIMLGPNKSKERKKYMIYTEASFPPANKAFYVRFDFSEIEKYEDLYDLSIATNIGKKYFERFDNDRKLKKDPITDYAFGMRKVEAGRNDVIIMPEQEGDYLIEKHNANLRKCKFIHKGNVSFITISKKSKYIYLKLEIEKAMINLKKDGIMEKIIESYK